jgi:lipoyl(octanoyl) transferase
MNIEVKNSIKPIDYNKAIKILEQRVEDVILGKKNEFLWILEHNKVYTSGLRTKDNEILNKSIKVVRTKRGGKATVHSCGQKVIYFVLNLNRRKKDIRKLVTNVEKCIIKSLKYYNVKSFTDKNNIGIWVKDRDEEKKIAAIGIRVKKWIAYHGFSINVSNNLKYYKNIIPCGIKDRGVISLKEIGVKKYKNINKIIIKNFLSTFL